MYLNELERKENWGGQGKEISVFKINLAGKPTEEENYGHQNFK